MVQPLLTSLEEGVSAEFKDDTDTALIIKKDGRSNVKSLTELPPVRTESLKTSYDANISPLKDGFHHVPRIISETRNKKQR